MGRIASSSSRCRTTRRSTRTSFQRPNCASRSCLALRRTQSSACSRQRTSGRLASARSHSR
eukprot:4892712-Prymnesium_polylepis.2